MDEQFEMIAVAAGGFVSRTQVLDCGNTDTDIRDAIASGQWVRVHRGYYSPARWWTGLTPEQRHVVRFRIPTERFGDGVAVSHRSACAMRGRALWGQDLDVVHVTRLDGRTSRDEAGVVHHTGRLRDEDLEIVDGVLCTIEPRALWESACGATTEGAMVTFDSALHADPDLVPRVWDLAPVVERWPGSRHAGLALRLSDGGAETPGETRGRYMFWRFGIPRPTLQYEVYARDGRLIGRTDYAWLEGKHLGEFDGLVKYQRDMSAGESPSQVVVREKSREDELRSAGEGAGMSRLIWSELRPNQQPETAARVRFEIARSARVFGKDRVVIPLAG